MLETIKSSTDISYLFAHGKRYSAHSITLLVSQSREQHDPQGRVAFIAGKKLGGAVWRNSAKRRMRAACHEAGGPWPGLDVVFIARRDVLDEEFASMVTACRKAVARAAREIGEQPAAPGVVEGQQPAPQAEGRA